MNSKFECGDSAALVTFQYGESDPAEREVVAAHLEVCPACTAEIDAMRATRAQLQAWTPPELGLGSGFRAPAGTGAGAAVGGAVLRPARWWQRPLPAWAQAAAAAVLFVGGLGLGGAASLWLGPDAAPAGPVSEASIEPSVSPADLSALEERLRAEIAQVRGVLPAADETPVIDQVQDLIAQSEARQRRELALRTAEVLRDFDAQRRVDLEQVQQTVGDFQGMTGADLAEQRRLIDYLIRVSQQQ